MEIEILGSSRATGRRWQSDGAIFAMPTTDARQAHRAASHMAKRAGAPGLILVVHDDARDGFISIANRLFERTDSVWFGYVAQDAYAGRDWLAHAQALCAKPAINLVAFNDGKWFGSLAAYGLARRSWAKSNYAGPLFFPDYRRHYADTEISLIASEQSGLGYSANSVLVELDWEKDAMPVDAADRKLFLERSRAGFDSKISSNELRSRFS